MLSWIHGWSGLPGRRPPVLTPRVGIGTGRVSYCMESTTKVRCASAGWGHSAPLEQQHARRMYCRSWQARPALYPSPVHIPVLNVAGPSRSPPLTGTFPDRAYW